MPTLPDVLTTSNPGTATLVVWLFINAFAVARIARLIAIDTITSRPRHFIQRRFEGSLVELVTCVWCLSVWFALAAAVLTISATTRGWWLLVASVLAIAQLAGMINEVA